MVWGYVCWLLFYCWFVWFGLLVAEWCVWIVIWICDLFSYCWFLVVDGCVFLAWVLILRTKFAILGVVELVCYDLIDVCSLCFWVDTCLAFGCWDYCDCCLTVCRVVFVYWFNILVCGVCLIVNVFGLFGFWIWLDDSWLVAVLYFAFGCLLWCLLCFGALLVTLILGGDDCFLDFVV